MHASRFGRRKDLELCDHEETHPSRKQGCGRVVGFVCLSSLPRPVERNPELFEPPAKVEIVSMETLQPCATKALKVPKVHLAKNMYPKMASKVGPFEQKRRTGCPSVVCKGATTVNGNMHGARWNVESFCWTCRCAP